MEPQPSTPKSLRRTALPYLTKIAHGSASFIGTFLLIHLTAPVLANLGGSSLSSQVMLLGREYYQTSFGEKYLVLLPLVAHCTTSIAKRLLSPQPIRPWSTLLSVTGYAAFGIFLPIHFITHRVNPSDPSSPIYSVGPAELDYEFVKVGLQTWPWRSWMLYAGLVGCVALHASEGMNLIWNTWLRGSLGKPSVSQKTRRIGAGAAAGLVLSGLLVVSLEPLMTFMSLASRYQESFSKTWIYRL
ncbi:hypothetical protein JAAARDRAFT_127085 [Jaapia argillacea MUCL 33604]|uniref:Mitochondrial adapter protein MCP1 transmembrane domain-containing protein n=1 Tax=Jaapia argillacea MUCL 33604 TaxID=933084 RepID=A0A067QAW4_9AGAM|nr:hypothetical protein JAAARDRAFT_127085 [Jaapia argillacea MUCL 33604]